MLRTSRRRPSAALLIALLALFFSLTGWGNAATVKNFVLGRTNRAQQTTGLASASAHSPGLAVTNTRGATAASFSVRAGVSPFTVNSAVKVSKLNADSLDGLDSAALQRRVSGTCGAGAAIKGVNGDGSVACQSVGASGGGAVTSWGLNGSKGTNATKNFIGTTDAQPLVIRTNNKEALRVSPNGRLDVGTTDSNAQVDVLSPTGVSGLLVTTAGNTAVVARTGLVSCPALSAVEGCGSTGVTGVLGTSDSIGVRGDSPARGVVGTLGGTSCAGTYAVGGCGATRGAGVYGNGTTVGVRGVVGSALCPGPSAPPAVEACGGTTGNGIFADSFVPANSFTAAAIEARNSAGGDIFIGEGEHKRVARIDGNGKAFFDGGTQSSGADYADSMRAVHAARMRPGEVLELDPAHPGQVRESASPSSSLVAGVYSTKPSLLGVGSHQSDGALRGEVPVALVGIVPTDVSAENGAVHVGDLLVSAGTPGYAMKASSIVFRGTRIVPTGSILGKALQPLMRGKGKIEVLVTLR